MYAVSAQVNHVQAVEVALKSDFQIDLPAVSRAIEFDPGIKLIFVCSPNNPSGNLMAAVDIEALLQSFNGLVVLDEAYIDFADQPSWAERLVEFPNLVILQTFSKARGLAGARLGMAFARQPIIDILSSIKPPYNISELNQKAALAALKLQERTNQIIAELKTEREKLHRFLQSLSFVETVFPSQANFILIRLRGAGEVQERLLRQGIIVRNRSGLPHCPSCLRITVGSPRENKRLMQVLSEMESQR
jgi:histidinol-phosphate aminotransferase